ncbi:3-hydroxyisobutyrate dehydrogenase [Sphingomonas sp. Leaf231]|uniref:3-hydroxyisobutyrate dehydrogenase n=1 Tax=Sphingomonas sp. Leaf231 TaxID=1736301 RepID=UPI0007023299|nr:3-hydroxyisobutyrate dehydrogenase [Sphingomonas sp. Leaf231]KQN90545.1 3-hydroxyisobutyrate dehydrogenase [Sphingomonas sp. Leaf231]
MARVGFIGLGNMGGGMAANLAKKGHDVRAFDLSAAALDAARAAGCLPVGSAREAADGAEAVITMLPAGTHVAQVYADSLGETAVDTVLIDCSTIDLATARRIAAEAAARGIAAVDAPVSGGIAAAQAGTLTFMVGGTVQGFDRARPFLDDMGKAVIHAGESGAGQVAKMCNNLILGATMAATCEAFALAERLGLDAQTFYDISSKATGQSWSMTSYCPVPGVGPESPADRNYGGGFAGALMLKDLELAMAAAGGADAQVPMGARARDLYREFVDAGQGGLDFSGIIRMLSAPRG